METRNLDGLLAEFVNQSKAILGANLAGIYLHGSAVMGCYNPKKSDIDIIIVTNDDMTDYLKRAYMDMVVRAHSLAPAKGIEMSIVKQQVCNPFVYPTPFELHFSEVHLQWYMESPDDFVQKMNGTDKDLAAHFTILRRRGRCLYGLPIEEMFAEVPKRDYVDAIYCEEQVNGAFDEMEKRLAIFDLTLENVVQMDCLFRDIWNIPVMEKIVKERFHGKYPVRKSIQTEFAHVGGENGLQFQADAIAYGFR